MPESGSPGKAKGHRARKWWHNRLTVTSSAINAEDWAPLCNHQGSTLRQVRAPEACSGPSMPSSLLAIRRGESPGLGIQAAGWDAAICSAAALLCDPRQDSLPLWAGGLVCKMSGWATFLPESSVLWYFDSGSSPAPESVRKKPAEVWASWRTRLSSAQAAFWPDCCCAEVGPLDQALEGRKKEGAIICLH